ncbi:MAG: hypothetical protein ACI81I_000858 [Arcobacteraceae bacterium]|jgi:hypothetical protein
MDNKRMENNRRESYFYLHAMKIQLLFAENKRMENKNGKQKTTLLIHK